MADPPDRARLMLTGWGVNSLFTPMKSLFQAVPGSDRGQECLHDAQGPHGKQWRPLWDQFGDFDFTAARSAAAHGDDFTAILPTSHLHNSSPFAPFLILIEVSEANMVRSLQIHPCLSVPHSLITANQHAAKTRRR